ncbi:MAG: NfeD family protein [Chlamydiota bacterium]
MMVRFVFLLFCLFGRVHAETLLLNLSGHLSAPLLEEAKRKLSSGQHDEVLLYLDSWTGELPETIALAQQIYSLKLTSNIKVSVYVENRAVGPSAIFPFLADDWSSTAVMVWGDLYYGSSNDYPQNQLLETVRNLISTLNPQASLLYLMAEAMVKPTVQLVKESDEWTLAAAPQGNERLVVNRHFLDAAGFDIDTLTSDQFHARYPLAFSSATSTLAPNVSVEDRLSQVIHYSQTATNNVGFLSIESPQGIDDSTYLYVKFALEEFKKRGVIFVILHLNTPGGAVFPSMRIAEMLQRLDIEDHIPVVAILHNWALSAGAMLAYSSRFIVVTDKSLMGAAEPVMQNSQGGMESAPEKINSALRAEFASLAQYFGRNPYIAEAMVDKDLIVVQRHGEILKLNDKSEIRQSGESPDMVIIAEGKLLTLTGRQLLDLKVADFYLPTQVATDIDQSNEVITEWPASESPLFSYPFFAKIPSAVIITYANWKIDFFALLCNPVVSSLLMMGLVLGIYLELSSPGFGVAGFIALVCLTLILMTSYAVAAFNWLEVILIVVGVVLLLAEILILPGYGVIGILGALMMLVGIGALLLPNVKQVHFSFDTSSWDLNTLFFVERLEYLLGALLLALILIIVLARFITPRLMKRNSMVLKGEQHGYIARPEARSLPPVHSEGTAFSSLKPGGKILIDNHLYDAISETGFIERDERVVVIKITGSTIIVAKK